MNLHRLRTGIKTFGYFLLLTSPMASPRPGFAAELNYGLGYSLEHSDNIGLVPNNPQEEWIHIARAQMNLQESSRTLEAHVGAQAQYRDYQEKTFANETLYDLNAAAIWQISPQRFRWIAEDYFTQTKVNPLGASTPANLQNTNVFSTGPVYTVRLSPVHSVEFGALYARDTYSQTANSTATTALDNTRDTGNVRWIYQSTPTTDLSLNYQAQRVKYDNEDMVPNFDRRDLTFEVAHSITRNKFVLDLGRTDIKRDVLGTTNGNLAELSWTHLLATQSTFALYLLSQLSDVGNETLAAGRSEPLIGPGASTNTVSADIFRTKRAEAVYAHRRALGNDTLRIFKERLRFQTDPLQDEDRNGGNIDMGYEFSAVWTGSVFFEYLKTDNFGSNVQFTDKNYGARILNLLSKNLSLGLEFRRNVRESPDPTRIYEEKQVLLTLTYNNKLFYGGYR